MMNTDEIKTLQDNELEQVDGGLPTSVVAKTPSRPELAMEDAQRMKENRTTNRNNSIR